MNDLNKLQILLQHWLEHNSSHVKEFSKWQDQIADEHPSISDKIGLILGKMDEINVLLNSALDDAGGPTEHHHHHNHEH